MWALAWVYVHDAGEQFAAGKLENQFGAAARSQFRHFRIGATAEARGSLSMQFQKACCAANGYGIEPGTFDQNVFCGEGDFRFRASHDAANADGARAVTIANKADARIQ